MSFSLCRSSVPL